MNVVIDAQIVAAFYKESVLATTHDCSASPMALFGRLGTTDVALVDDGGHIETEWRMMAEPEWFSNRVGVRTGDSPEMRVSCARRRRVVCEDSPRCSL